MSEQNLGISTHLNTFYRSLINKNTPPHDILQSLRSLRQILHEKQKNNQEKINKNRLIAEHDGKQQKPFITLQELQELEIYQKKVSENQRILKVMEISREIDIKLVQFQDNILMSEDVEEVDKNLGDKQHVLDTRLRIFKEIYTLIHLFNDEINENVVAEGYEKMTENLRNAQRLKQKFLSKLKKKLSKAIIQCFYNSMSKSQKLQEGLSFFHLPLKPNTKLPEQDHTNTKTREAFQHQDIIIQALFTEYCCYCLHRKIQLILQENSSKQTQIFGNGEQEHFKSIFFTKLWHKINKSIAYIFINSSSFGEQQENAYQIDQPKWMFDYMESSFNKNSKFIEEIISKNNHKNIHKAQITQCIKTYIISYNTKQFFLRNIIDRLENDVMFAKNEKIQNKDFIIYNFLQELHILENKISIQHDYEVSFIESVLIWADEKRLKLRRQYMKREESGKSQQKSKKNSTAKGKKDVKDNNISKQQQQLESAYNLLALNFDYEHQWFEDRIFNVSNIFYSQDFYNINYSKEVDIRNIQAYNIVVNFIQLFQKMYSKFKKVQPIQNLTQQNELSEKGIKDRINQFYHQCIIRLVRHIKTSFERIYNNYNSDSIHNKYEILMGFKKVQDQFRAYFANFLKTSLQFEQKIQTQYYQALEHFTMLYALQELNPIHKKIYKKLTQITDHYFMEKIQVIDEEKQADGQERNLNEKEKERQKISEKWKKIHLEWTEAMDRINRIKSRYKDDKMRNIFFVFLESTQFSPNGFKFFFELFEPFLARIFHIQGQKVLKLLTEMEKGTLKQYIKSHANVLTFLTSSQIRAIEKIDKTYGIQSIKSSEHSSRLSSSVSTIKNLVSKK